MSLASAVSLCSSIILLVFAFLILKALSLITRPELIIAQQSRCSDCNNGGIKNEREDL